ncbi:hypothetical protein CRG98_043038, partial [Punica granatum]
ISRSAIFGRSTGSSRPLAYSGTESDSFQGRSTGASPAPQERLSSGQRVSSQLGYADPRRIPRRSITHTRDYESALKGIEKLRFDSNGRA